MVRRREVLKQAGLATGLGAIGVETATANPTSSEGDLIETESVVSELRFEVDSADATFPKTSYCRQFPQMIRSQVEQRRRVHVGRADDHGVDLSSAGSLVASNEGIGTDSDEDYCGMPENGSPLGLQTLIVESKAPSVSIDEASSERFAVVVGDAELDVPEGESTEATYTTELPYGKDAEKSAEVTVLAEAEHHGTVDVIGHPEHVVLPKEQPWIQFVKEQRSGKAQERGAPPMKVIEHQKGYELVPKREANQ